MNNSRFDRLTRRLAGRTTRRTVAGASLAALALGGLDHATYGQGTPVPISSPDPAATEAPAFMFVQTAASGRGEVNLAAGTPATDGTPVPGGGASFLLTLDGHTGQTIYFSDRPAREVGAVPTQKFLDRLGFGAENPPNAALVAEFERGQGVVVLELIEPVYDADSGTLIYGVEALAGYQGENLTPVLADQVAARLPAEFGPAALFIDSCWDLTVCWCWGDNRSTYKWRGDIPMGHISTRWALAVADCVVTEDDWEAGVSSCWNAYDCDGPMLLGRSDGPFTGWVCDGVRCAQYG